MLELVDSLGLNLARACQGSYPAEGFDLNGPPLDSILRVQISFSLTPDGSFRVPDSQFSEVPVLRAGRVPLESCLGLLSKVQSQKPPLEGWQVSRLGLLSKAQRQKLKAQSPIPPLGSRQVSS